MSTLFQRPTTKPCFFCNSTITNVKNPLNFRCPSCSCWNRYDSNGEILSDDPAMHDENLNRRSFAKRASPVKDRLPTIYGNGPFCHTCQTNQMLVVNLLSNYLPPPNSPNYTRRLESLPNYKSSLEIRYPTVCDNCLPAVEEEIRRKDAMARTQALGALLNKSKVTVQGRRVSAPERAKEKLTFEILAWRVRGGLWLGSLLVSLAVNVNAALGRQLPPFLGHIRPVLPALALFSLLWTAWDPTYASFQGAKLQGRDVRVRGKRNYVVAQMISWASRLITSTLLAIDWYGPHANWLQLLEAPLRNRVYFAGMTAVEVIALVYSCVVLRLQHPPPIRLIQTKSHTFSPSRSATPGQNSRPSSPTDRTALQTTTAAADSDLLAALSLSSKPIITPSPPIFGFPSLSNPPPQTSSEEIDDQMDWTPTDPSAATSSSHQGQGKNRTSQKKTAAVVSGSDDGSWLRPQRFFAPEAPTGLEGLFERTKLVDDAVPMDVSGDGARRKGRTITRQEWASVVGFVVVLVLGVSLGFWLRSKAESRQHLGPDWADVSS